MIDATLDARRLASSRCDPIPIRAKAPRLPEKRCHDANIGRGAVGRLHHLAAVDVIRLLWRGKVRGNEQTRSTASRSIRSEQSE